MIVDELVDLAAAMIDAFMSGGKVPAVPEGRRDEVVSTLTRLMVDRSLLLRYNAALTEEHRQRGVGELLAEREFPELPIDEILHGGFTTLADDQLAELACRPVTLTCLHELMQAMMDDDMVGDFWWEEIDRQETDNPGVLAESEREMIERLKILDSIEDALRARGLRD